MVDSCRSAMDVARYAILLDLHGSFVGESGFFEKSAKFRKIFRFSGLMVLSDPGYTGKKPYPTKCRSSLLRGAILPEP